MVSRLFKSLTKIKLHSHHDSFFLFICIYSTFHFWFINFFSCKTSFFMANYPAIKIVDINEWNVLLKICSISFL